MSRPKSIVLFDRLYLLSIVVSLIGAAVTWNATMAKAMSSPAMIENPEMAPMVTIGSIAGIGIYVAITLLLWWLIAYKANDVVKWVFVVLNVIGIAGVAFSLFAMNAEEAVAVYWKAAAWLFAIPALFFLFRPDANAWFASKGQVDKVDPFA